MQPVAPDRTRPAPVDRSADRRVALVSMFMALVFLGLALASLVLPVPSRRGLWLPLHLALAGGASTAIAGVMPFFVAAFAAAPPADARLRGAGIVGIAGGASGVVLGVLVAPSTWLAAVAGVGFLCGVVLTGLATLRPVTGALGPSRGIVTQAYVAALGAVMLGATVATLMVAGWTPVAEAWDRLRPAHAWLNLVGFVSLVIATTLLHFFPTVAGARIVPHPSARLTVLGVGAGAIAVAAGYSLAIDWLVRIGAGAAVGGALALVQYARRIWTARARWTTDEGWHRFVIGGLASAIGWFAVGMAILGGRALAFGADPGGWSIEAALAPTVTGWIVLAILASSTHLVPAVGPGDQAAHARQRKILGVAALTRLVAANLGITMLTLAVPAGMSAVAATGALLLTLPFTTTALLLGTAIRIGFTGSAGPSRS